MKSELVEDKPVPEQHPWLVPLEKLELLEKIEQHLKLLVTQISQYVERSFRQESMEERNLLTANLKEKLAQLNQTYKNASEKADMSPVDIGHAKYLFEALADGLIQLEKY